MKWMIASDLHGSAYYCRQLLDCFDYQRGGTAVFAGRPGPLSRPAERFTPRLRAKRGHFFAEWREKSAVLRPRQLRHRKDQMVLRLPDHGH